MLTQSQLDALTTLFRHGSEDASAALSKWLGRTARISIEQVQQLPLSESTDVLQSDGPICSCAMAMTGPVTGQLILAFDDASGLALADLLLGNPLGTSSAWGEVERSAALETTNIIGCAYLNTMSRYVRHGEGVSQDWIPCPPRFLRDFAPAVLQAALMNQAIVSDHMFLTRTQFRVEDAPVDWNLLFIPDGDCVPMLQELLSG